MDAEWIEPIRALTQAAHTAAGAQTALLPGVGAEIGTVMIATVAATVFMTGALKGVVGARTLDRLGGRLLAALRPGKRTVPPDRTDALAGRERRARARSSPVSGRDSSPSSRGCRREATSSAYSPRARPNEASGSR